jgi:hypothetical protein
MQWPFLAGKPDTPEKRDSRNVGIWPIRLAGHIPIRLIGVWCDRCWSYLTNRLDRMYLRSAVSFEMNLIFRVAAPSSAVNR